MLKHVLFTHDDLDGAGCRIVFELAKYNMKKGAEYDIIICGNNTINGIVLDALSKEDYISKDGETEIYFADICPSLEVLRKLADEYKNVKIFDHHVTNFPAQNVFPNAVIMPENNFHQMQSGTSLLYQHFVEITNTTEYGKLSAHKSLTDTGKWGKLIGKFVDTVRAYDTYEFKETGEKLPKQLQTLFFLLGMERFVNKYMERFTSIQYPSESIILPNDMLFVDSKLEFEQRVIDNLSIDDVKIVDVKGYKTAFLLMPVAANISEVGYQFLDRNPDIDMLAYFSLARGGEFSFRTQRTNLDVGKDIAEPIGGGGHPKASGAPINENLQALLSGMLIAFMNGNDFNAVVRGGIEKWL